MLKKLFIAVGFLLFCSWHRDRFHIVSMMKNARRSCQNTIRENIYEGANKIVADFLYNVMSGKKSGLLSKMLKVLKIHYLE
jgi:hypothetical protein